MRNELKGLGRLLAMLASVVAVTGTLTAQTTSGSISGTVHDAQGAAVPGARVTATSASRGEVTTATTDGEGRFVFPQLQPGRYSLRAELQGFKTVEKTGVVLNANDKISAGVITLQVGTVSEAVEVAAHGTELQAVSAERSASLTEKQLESIAVNSRSYLQLVGLAPGVVNTANLTVAGHAGLGNISANGARFNQNNLTLDGVGNVDTGNNGDQLATLSLDAVSEYKILTANYQAEYGRSSGAQISVVTKSGGRDFHGSGYLYRRHDSDLLGIGKVGNANNWRNNRDGIPVSTLRLNDFGYTLGGPVVIPGKFNEGRDKLFFFVAQEFQHQFRPQAARNVRVPTALERQGDFSQSVDRSGNLFPYIRDYQTGLPCSASNTAGCFQDGGVLGRIPKNRLYQPGLAILGMFPLPNSLDTVRSGFNFTSQISDDYPRREDLARIDFHPSASWRIFARYVNNYDQVTSNYGSFVLGANVPLVPIVDKRPGRGLALSVTKILGPTMVNEFTFGYGHNQINIDPTSDGLTKTKLGLAGLPVLFPGAIQNDFVPRFDWTGRVAVTAAANQARNGDAAAFGTNNAPFFNFNTTYDLIDNLSKVFGRHSVKVGVYFQRSLKDQTSFANANGLINFGDDSSNPFDSGFGYANTALGIYSTFNQASQYATGRYRYNNIEWYLQDNWRLSSRLTLDYGMRFYLIPPQYDAALQTSTFLPDRFDPSRAVRLYRPTRDASGNRIGIDPVTGQTTAAVNIGKIVPGSGDLLNGIVQAGQGVPKGLMKNRGVHFGPRLGFAWDVGGRQKLVVRGGGGIFYDRFQGNETFDMLTNPPTTVAPTLQNGLLQELDPTKALRAPSGLNAFSFDGKVPTVYNYNLGVQAKLPFDLVLDVSYVGSQSRHLLQRVNINAVPYGATYKAENQDPTKSSSLPGGAALDADFLRPYQGFGNITQHQMGGTANYNSLQWALTRPFTRGLLVGINHTWARSLGTANVDGDFFRIDGENRQANYGLLSNHRAHTVNVFYVYELPKVAGWGALARGLLNDWQVSGNYRFQTGAPYTVGFSIPGVGNTNLTGSYTEGARIRIVGPPGSGTTGDPYRQVDASAFAPPGVGSVGLESGRNTFVGPGINVFDLSLQKTIRFHRESRLELRFDAFNVFNHPQYSGVNSTLNFRSLTDPTPTNLPFDSAGNLVNKNGFGTVNGARDPRILQVVARVRF